MWTFNPLPSHEGRHSGFLMAFRPWRLSIHFPLTREDANWKKKAEDAENFQSTSLSRGKTHIKMEKESIMFFQSTSLSRGKTILRREVRLVQRFQSTSLSRGKTDGLPDDERAKTFQSTSLSRGKTAKSTNFPFQSNTFFRHIVQTHNI